VDQGLIEVQYQSLLRWSGIARSCGIRRHPLWEKWARWSWRVRVLGNAVDGSRGWGLQAVQMDGALDSRDTLGHWRSHICTLCPSVSLLFVRFFIMEFDSYRTSRRILFRDWFWVVAFRLRRPVLPTVIPGNPSICIGL
jgi:hypothetical protein